MTCSVYAHGLVTDAESIFIFTHIFCFQPETMAAYDEDSPEMEGRVMNDRLYLQERFMRRLTTPVFRGMYVTSKLGNHRFSRFDAFSKPPRKQILWPNAEFESARNGRGFLVGAPFSIDDFAIKRPYESPLENSMKSFIILNKWKTRQALSNIDLHIYPSNDRP